ncbi:predicted protein [Nematostella vectensis]|uniref:Uncharacterized protein n=1 Tax=Nematostella vectensis TaxID=45351 RepID=A7RR78_NEMVE|nr:predicted protein [Nematostella vectensis]|eukprot:XP_001638181.1 predicted protein [Nematostella vectensis]
MASKEEMREILRDAIRPLELKADDLKSSVEHLNKKYDDILSQMGKINQMVQSHGSSIRKLEKELNEEKQRSNEALEKAEELAEYLRRDCLKIYQASPLTGTTPKKT